MPPVSQGAICGGRGWSGARKARIVIILGQLWNGGQGHERQPKIFLGPTLNENSGCCCPVTVTLFRTTSVNNNEYDEQGKLTVSGVISCFAKDGEDRLAGHAGGGILITNVLLGCGG